MFSLSDFFLLSLLLTSEACGFQGGGWRKDLPEFRWLGQEASGAFRLPPLQQRQVCPCSSFEVCLRPTVTIQLLLVLLGHQLLSEAQGYQSFASYHRGSFTWHPPHSLNVCVPVLELMGTSRSKAVHLKAMENQRIISGSLCRAPPFTHAMEWGNKLHPVLPLKA